jgi:predicted ATP-grasp superfamily ATP-dependent carboligase
MLEAARNAGLLVPEWVTLNEDAFRELEQQCETLHFPCIVKPVMLKTGGILEFHILQNIDELKSVQEYLYKNCMTVIIQEYIHKTAEYGINACRLYHSGETVFCGVIEKERFSQVSLGSTTAGMICPDRYGICEQVRKFVEFIDYRGILIWSS